MRLLVLRCTTDEVFLTCFVLGGGAQPQAIRKFGNSEF
jgi:hypothetical protein